MILTDSYRLKVSFKSDEADNVAQITPVFLLNGLIITDTNESDLVQAFQGECEAALLACVSSSLRLVKYEVVPLPGNAASYVLDLGTSGPTGGRTGDRMPPRSAGILSFRTAVLSRRGRGRMFLPPASEADNSAGRPALGYLDLVNAFGETMKTDINVDTVTHAAWLWCVFSREDQEIYEVTNYVTRDYWGSQRDRTKIF